MAYIELDFGHFNFSRIIINFHHLLQEKRLFLEEIALRYLFFMVNEKKEDFVLFFISMCPFT